MCLLIPHCSLEHDQSNIHWISKRAVTRLSGDLCFLSNVVGHNGHRCKYPCFMCDVTKHSAKSFDNLSGSNAVQLFNYRTNFDTAQNAVDFANGAPLTRTDGIGHAPLLPIYPWRWTLSTFHICEGIFFFIQSALFLAVDRLEGCAEQNEKVKELKKLNAQKRHMEWRLSQVQSLQHIKEYGYGVQEVELKTPAALEDADATLITLEEKIKHLLQQLEPHLVYKKFHDFLETHKLKQKDYRSGSVKGITVKYNIKHYEGLTKIIEEIDEELAVDWNATMSAFATIHAKITQHG